MREILFRGKRKDIGKWVYGYYIPLGDKKRHFITTGKIDLLKNPIDLESYEIYPQTRGEYTGLTDKNGVKIFEGDICEFCYDEDEVSSPHLVKWLKEKTCFTVIEIYENKLNGGTEDLDEFFAKNCKVIGNIHDNPELLKR